MTVEQQLKKDGVSNDDILRMFKEAQRELIAVIEKMGKGSSFATFRRKHLLVIDRIVAAMDREAKQWAKEALPPIMDAGAEETYEKMKKIKEKEFGVSFSGVSREMVNVFLEQAWGDFGTTMIGLKKSAKNAALDKRKIQERIFKGFVQGTSATRTQQEIMNDLRKEGFTVLKGRNGFGRKWSLESYTNMLVRTQNVTAYSLGAKAQSLGAGRRYMIIPTLRDIDGEDICNEWERRKYVDLMNDPLPPYHPNCGHTPQPVSFEQLQKERPDLYESAIRYWRDTFAE